MALQPLTACFPAQDNPSSLVNPNHTWTSSVCCRVLVGPAAGSHFPSAFSCFSSFPYAPAEEYYVLKAQSLALNLFNTYYIARSCAYRDRSRSSQLANKYPIVLKYGTQDEVATAVPWVDREDTLRESFWEERTLELHQRAKSRGQAFHMEGSHICIASSPHALSHCSPGSC